MSNINKKLSERDGNQVLQSAFNDVDSTISINGPLTGKVGMKVTATITTTNVANDTVVYAYTDSGTALYSITVVYTDGTRETFLSAERTA